jgi:2-methylcitrate dehydratase
MTHVQRLARFVADASPRSLSEKAREQLKGRVLDSLGTAIGAMDGPPMVALRRHVETFHSGGPCSLIGGGRTSPVFAALRNGALVRYLDFNDSYLAPGETCHPSDNLGAILAAAEYADASGEELLCALAVAYQVQCRLSEEAPVREHGFDHTVQGSYAAAAGVAKALRLSPGETAHALSMAGTALNALRVTRTGTLSNWKGLAYPFTAFAATQLAFLASEGITGPPEVFEGVKGFGDSIAGPFDIDWESEDLEAVTKTILKKYNAEIHSQATIEGVLQLREKHGLSPEAIEQVEIDTFAVAYHIIGGGREGEKTDIASKEEADHSLPYITAAALLDGEVTPRQYETERIRRRDVQDLLRRISVRASERCSEAFPDTMPCDVRVRCSDDTTVDIRKDDYEGFHTRPMSWENLTRKFDSLAREHTTPSFREQLVATVRDLERHSARDLFDTEPEWRNPS